MLKLTKKPYRSGTGHYDKLVYETNDGEKRNLRELADFTQIHFGTIQGRISQLGWKHPDILKKVTTTTGYAKEQNNDEALRILIENDNLCPIMQGASNLRITRSGWKTACKFHRGRPTANNNKYPSNRYCAICEGKDIPKGVEWITKKELKCFVEGRK